MRGGRFDGWVMLLRRGFRRAFSSRAPVDEPLDTRSGRSRAAAEPADDSALARGLRDIQRMDPKFDPDRFVGYAGMVFRDAQSASTRRDLGALRDRVTPEIHGAWQARCDELRRTGRVNRVERVEITAEVTEAWHENGRDYVTAHIQGSTIDYTVDEQSDRVVHGSRTIPRKVEDFWTFTRPGGLNFWTLSAIRTS